MSRAREPSRNRFADGNGVPAWRRLPRHVAAAEDFAEPMVRINTDRVDGAAFGWSEAAAWDAEAEFYKARARG